ncbi:MAG: hypothetical protein AAB477_00985 [Patescibacteria group bacterium]
MKNIFFYVIACCFLTTCDVKPRANNQQHSTIAVSVILDVTDPRSYWPGPDQLLQLFHFKQTPEAEGLFRLRTISDKRLTPIISYRLADAQSMEKENRDDDPQFRNKNVVAFYNTVRKSMNDFYSQADTTQSLSNSECYRAITDELTFLSETKSDQRTLIIASDLMEKSDLQDCYTANLSNSKAIATLFEKANLLPQNLSEITVIFLFNPRDRNEDKKFSLMVEAYKILLLSKGAEIKVQANL